LSPGAGLGGCKKGKEKKRKNKKEKKEKKEKRKKGKKEKKKKRKEKRKAKSDEIKTGNGLFALNLFSPWLFFSFLYLI